MDIKLISEELGFGAALESRELALSCSEDMNGFEIKSESKRISIRYGKTAYLCRALSYLKKYGEADFCIAEQCRFNSNGIMIDCSRNAVNSVETVKRLIRMMALMGLDTLMLYTEDTYEIEGHKYFGYLRGKYTADELKELDEYAYSFGVELVPCIQTLAHLASALKWDKYGKIRDTEDILLVDEPETYDFIEDMLKSCRKVFRTEKIHIGMDEAHMLGRGRYYDLYGDSDKFTLMSRHLGKVVKLCEKYNFKPMMWSDMYFRLANDGDYYGPNAVSAEIAATVPDGVDQVYWDYYKDSQSSYERMIVNHKNMPGKLIFAGGAWKWEGYIPALSTSFKRTRASLEACKTHGIKDVFTTAWGDDGADAGLYTVLPVFQLQAELGFKDSISEEELSDRLNTCTGADLKAFMLLETDDDIRSAHKYLLFQDPMLGMFDLNIPEGAGVKYEKAYKEIEKIAPCQNDYKYLFDTVGSLCSVLAIKAELGVKIKAAYDNRELETLKKISSEILPELITRLNTFRDNLETQWLYENKPFGFEIQDIRIGGLLRRLETARERITAYVNGSLKSLPELEGERLPYGNSNSGEVIFMNKWISTISAGKYQG